MVWYWRGHQVCDVGRLLTAAPAVLTAMRGAVAQARVQSMVWYWRGHQIQEYGVGPLVSDLVSREWICVIEDLTAHPQATTPRVFIAHIGPLCSFLLKYLTTKLVTRVREHRGPGCRAYFKR